jgi:hypothetical protein
MVYMDLMGTTSSTLHRINDLSLRVTAPNGTIYWGNNGLLSGNWSTAGGSANTIDTVENVFVQNPAAGTWTVDIIASQINEDSHVETPTVDADFALVVSGVVPPQTKGTVPDDFTAIRGLQIAGGLDDVLESDDSYLKFQPGIVLSPMEPPVWIEFGGTLPDDSPTTLHFSVEASANTIGLTQTIEVFNFNSGQYELVDLRAASVNSDLVATIDLSAEISNVVQSGTGAVKSRIGWRATGPVVLLPWTICIDHVVWH